MSNLRAKQNGKQDLLPLGLQPLLLTAKQAAAFCGMSLSSWNRKVSAGLIGPNSVTIGSGCIRWLRADLEAWVAERCPARERWVEAENGAR